MPKHRRSLLQSATDLASCAAATPDSTCVMVSDIELLDSEEGITFTWNLQRPGNAASCPEITEFAVFVKPLLAAQLDGASTSVGPAGQVWSDGISAGDHVSWSIPSHADFAGGRGMFVSFTLKGVDKVADVCTLGTEDCSYVLIGASGCYSGTSASSFMFRRQQRLSS